MNRSCGIDISIRTRFVLINIQNLHASDIRDIISIDVPSAEHPQPPKNNHKDLPDILHLRLRLRVPKTTRNRIQDLDKCLSKFIWFLLRDLIGFGKTMSYNPLREENKTEPHTKCPAPLIVR
jgi:hypothetical protein